MIALDLLFLVSVIVWVPSLADNAGGFWIVVSTAPASFWVLVGLALVVDVPLVRIRGWAGSWILTSATFCFAIGYVWDRGAGRVVQALAIVVASGFAWRGIWSSAFDIGRYCSALVAAVVVADVLGPHPLSENRWAALLSLLLTAVAWYVTFRLVTATGAWLYEGGRWVRALLHGQPAEALSAVALLFLAMLLGETRDNLVLLALVAVPVVAIGHLSHLYLQLQWQATRDPLIGLPNRLALEQSAAQPIRRLAAQRDNREQAAFFAIDVDQLSRVNHALGHRIGDRVLIAVGNRLAPLAGVDTSVARLEGDRFGVFACPVAGSTDVLARADAVRALFDEPLSVDGFSLIISVSIGVSLCPVHATSLDALSRYADVALERAKDLPSRVAVFRSDEEVATAEHLTLLADLDRALQAPGNTEIVAFYQPQVDMSTGEVVGAEALLRWRHPTRGMVSPEQVLRVAEYTPIMRKISMCMVDQVLAQLAVWQPKGLVLGVSVNVSVRDLQSAEFIEWLNARLRHHGVDPSCLQLELTETALMSQPELVVDCLKATREIGVGASLDDFGTGFSSLQHLRKLPLTEIKIERSFVQAIMERHEEESIIRAVVDLGRDLDLRVVAEGVEDDETKARLLAAGCRIAQGYYYAKPMSAGDFAEWCGHRTGRR